MFEIHLNVPRLERNTYIENAKERFIVLSLNDDIIGNDLIKTYIATMKRFNMVTNFWPYSNNANKLFNNRINPLANVNNVYDIIRNEVDGIIIIDTKTDLKLDYEDSIIQYVKFISDATSISGKWPFFGFTVMPHIDKVKTKFTYDQGLINKKKKYNIKNKSIDIDAVVQYMKNLV